jgi:hypothetical protein
MNAGLVTRTAVAALVVGSAGLDLTAFSRPVGAETVVSKDAPANAIASSQEKGRYKQEGDDCIWVTTDSGPNQCTPVTRGRFKKGGDDSCTWDSNDAGPDQCKPPKGRWKKGTGDDCTWDAKDDGPNQCNPRRARARK